MMRQLISLVLVSTFVLDFAVMCRAKEGEKDNAAQVAVKRKAESILEGTLVEVRLLNKEKIRGRIGEFTQEGFALQVKKGQNYEKRKVSFSDLKSIKQLPGGSTGAAIGKAAIEVIAIAAAVIGICILLFVAGAGNNS